MFQIVVVQKPNLREANTVKMIYVEIENHLDILNQNPVVMIARIFNML